MLVSELKEAEVAVAGEEADICCCRVNKPMLLFPELPKPVCRCGVQVRRADHVVAGEPDMMLLPNSQCPISRFAMPRLLLPALAHVGRAICAAHVEGTGVGGAEVAIPFLPSPIFPRPKLPLPVVAAT